MTPDQERAVDLFQRTTTEYRPNGVVMRYIRCPWCRARTSRAMKACSLCKGTGIESCERIR